MRLEHTTSPPSFRWGKYPTYCTLCWVGSKKGDFPNETQESSWSGWLSSWVLRELLGCNQIRSSRTVHLPSFWTTRIDPHQIWWYILLSKVNEIERIQQYMLSLFQLPKGVLKIQDYFRSRFFWKGDRERKKNIDWLTRVWFVALNTKKYLGFMTLRSRTWSSLVNGFPSLFPKMGYDKHSLGENVLAQIHHIEIIGNQETRTPQLSSWRRRIYSSHMVLSPLGMNQKLGSGRVMAR
jgi:hypothetical protein